MTLYDKIAAARQKLHTLPQLSSGGIKRLDEDFAIRYAYNSNAIEGSTLTELETRMVIKEGVSIPNKPLKNQIEALGHQKAYEYIRQLAADRVPVSEDTIQATHRLVLMDSPEDAGIYRDVNVYIANSDAVLVSADQVPNAMQRLIAEYESRKQRDHLVDAIAYLHLEFERVHPFVDGNGRTGRLLMNHELLLQGYPPIDIKNNDKGRYYYCFQAYQGADETNEPMTRLVGEYVLDALNERIKAIEQARKISNRRKDDLSR